MAAPPNRFHLPRPGPLPGKPRADSRPALTIPSGPTLLNRTGPGHMKAVARALEYVGKLAAVQTARELTDAQLLEQFVVHQDEAAFTVLVERHGPMVRGVCRRILRNS